MTVILKIMYLRPFKNFSYSVVFRNRVSSRLWRKQTERWSPLKAAFVTWTFRLPPVLFWTFSFHLQILHVFFFSSWKLQYCGTIVLLNKLKLFKAISFSIATMVIRFPSNKNAGLPKSTAQFPAKKRWHSPTLSGCLGTLLPLPQSLHGRTDAGTLTSQPKFLGSRGYQICLAIVLRLKKIRVEKDLTIPSNRFEVQCHHAGTQSVLSSHPPSLTRQCSEERSD